MTGVHVLGGCQTDFARHAERSGLAIGDLLVEAGRGALDDAGIAPAEVEVAHVGNFVGEVLGTQGHLGGLVADIDPSLEGVPASRHEAACASGSMAVLAAMADLEAGRYDVALVVGVEHMRAGGTAAASDALGLAARVPTETDGLEWPWPELFAVLDEEYDARVGVDVEHLQQLARWSFERAARNPVAQTRDWVLPPAERWSDDEANPVVAGRVRRLDCSQVTDGAAAVVLVSDRWLAAHPRRRRASIVGWGHRTARMDMRAKLEATRGEPYLLPHLRATIVEALGRARCEVTDLAGAEVHDCFTITEYAIADHLGLAPPGEAGRLVEDGVVGPGGAFELNPSGGLVGLGHPVGATGVRMLWDASRQVLGEAGAAQVPAAAVPGLGRFGTVNVGGSATTVASLVVAAPEVDRA